MQHAKGACGVACQSHNAMHMLMFMCAFVTASADRFGLLLCLRLCVVLLRCAPQQHQALRARQGPQVREGSWSQEEPWLQGISTHRQQQEQQQHWSAAAAAAAVPVVFWSSSSLLGGCWCVVLRCLCGLSASCHIQRLRLCSAKRCWQFACSSAVSPLVLHTGAWWGRVVFWHNHSSGVTVSRSCSCGVGLSMSMQQGVG